MKPFLLKDVIWNARKFRPSSVGCNPFLSLTLKVWDRYRELLAPTPSLVSSFLGQVPPGSIPLFILALVPTGFFWLCDISVQGRLLSKFILEEKYGVTIPWLQYMQLHFLFSCSSEFRKLNRSLTPFESLLKGSAFHLSGFISICYCFLKAPYWAQPSPLGQRLQSSVGGGLASYLGFSLV